MAASCFAMCCNGDGRQHMMCCALQARRGGCWPEAGVRTDDREGHHWCPGQALVRPVLVCCSMSYECSSAAHVVPGDVHACLFAYYIFITKIPVLSVILVRRYI